MRIEILLGLILVLFSCSKPPEMVPAHPDRGPFELLALHVQRCMWLSGNCSAGGALVVQDGKILYEEYFGREGRASGAAAVSAESRFPLFSVSKGFCASLVLALVSDGTIALDDPVAKYIQYFKGTGPVGKYDRGKVTIRMLAAHSGGLPSDSSPPRAWGAGQEPFGDIVLESDPGTAFHYSELGMRLLGYTLEQAGGKPYDQLLRERVLQPLGLASIGWVNHGDPLTHIVETELGRDSSYVHYSDEYSQRAYPGSGLYGNLGDIARYARLFLERGVAGNDKIFDGALLEQAWVNQPPGRAADPAYGLLFWLFPDVGADVFSGAAHTICCILPKQNMALVMGLNQKDDTAGWDFAAEKQNLARVGLALDQMLHPDNAKGQAGLPY